MVEQIKVLNTNNLITYENSATERVIGLTQTQLLILLYNKLERSENMKPITNS